MNRGTPDFVLLGLFFFNSLKKALWAYGLKITDRSKEHECEFTESILKYFLYLYKTSS